VLNRKATQVTQVPNADLIDLLLDADEATRKLIIFQALQTGAVKKSDAEEVMGQVLRLERAASPSPARAKARARGAAAASAS
jgi:hypothetical protein